jgi:hypothetical protein
MHRLSVTIDSHLVDLHHDVGHFDVKMLYPYHQSHFLDYLDLHCYKIQP